jgi:hypothetical protein
MTPSSEGPATPASVPEPIREPSTEGAEPDFPDRRKYAVRPSGSPQAINSTVRASNWRVKLAGSLPPGIGRLLLLDGRFVAAILALAAFAPGMASIVFKVWRVTNDPLPVIRISGVDWIEAASLKSAARSAEGGGESAKALHNWNAALAANPADLGALRGVFLLVIRHPEVLQGAGDRLWQSALWLLALSRTNDADVSLTVAALARARMDEGALRLGDQSEARLDDRAGAELAMARFRAGWPEGFIALWNARPEAFAKNPAAAIYHAGWMAGWGSSTNLLEGRRNLESAKLSPDPETAATGHRVALMVDFADLNLASYREELAWLVDHRRDGVEDHVNLWRLLAAHGRRVEAAALASKLVRSPETPMELVHLAGALADLGLEGEAVRRIEGGLKRHQEHPGVWVALARVKLKMGRWDEVSALAVDIRSAPQQVRSQLEGFSYFLAGAAKAAKGLREAAGPDMAQAAGRAWEAELGLECAGRMQSLGFPTQAEALLKQLEGRFSARIDFWFEMTRAAYALQDTNVILMATEKAWTLEPANTRAVNNYAAALLANRRDPQLALKLLVELRDNVGDGAALEINRALALNQIGRLDDAAALLGAVNPMQLPAKSAAAWHFALAENKLMRGAVPEARREFEVADKNFIFPHLRHWFTEELARRDGAGAAN